MNRLMIRLFSAQENGENPILDQVQYHIQCAKELGHIDTSQYSMTAQDDGSVDIYDKVHGETTKAVDTQSGVSLTDVPHSTLTVGDNVTWKDGDLDKFGKLVQIGDDTSKVKSSGKILSIKTKNLSGMDTGNKRFSKTRARHFLVDSNNNLMATGWESSLGKLLKDHPDWKMVDQYSIKDYLFRISKNFSSFSESNQKIFTKPYRRYVILDQAGKFKYLVDIDNAQGLVKNNPGYTMIKESEYNKSLQKKFENFSNTAVDSLINNNLI